MVKVVRKNGSTFYSRALFSLGNGRRVFCTKRLCGDDPFCISLPSLYALKVSKDAWVTNVRDHLGKRGHYNICFSRSLNDWEVNTRLQVMAVSNEKEDKVVWLDSRRDKFSIKTLYTILEPGGSMLFPAGIIWNL